MNSLQPLPSGHETLRDAWRFDVNAHNLTIRADQVRTRLAAYPSMLLIQLCLAPLLVWLMWDKVTELRLMSWLALTWGILLTDVVYFTRYRRAELTLERTRNWHEHFVLFVTLTGTFWGSAGVLMFVPHDLGFQAMLICVMLGLAAGAVTINPVHPPSLYLWLPLILLPITAMEFLSDESHGTVLGLMLLLYLGFVLHSGTGLNRMFVASLRRSHENASLLDLLREQTDRAEQLRAQAEAANREKSRFLAVASHDLRQPLQALMLFTDALQTQVGDHAPAKRLAGKIESSVNALLEMFNALLNISKLEAGVTETDWQNFALQPLLDRLHTDFLPLAQNSGLTLKIPAVVHAFGGIVYSDANLLEQMLRNLLANAIRYTEQGQVELRCTARDGLLEIAVIDTGVGISSDDLPKIFDEYYQSAAGNQRSYRQGLGLGLSIVRRVARLLDYRIGVESTLGSGSTFHFSVLPGDPNQEINPYQTDALQENFGGTRVFLLENDDEIRQAIVEILENWNCQVLAAASQDELIAQAIVSEQQPDVLFSDYRLSDGMTALELLHRARAKWGEHLPAIVLTGDMAPNILRELYAAGTLLLHKPLLPARLNTALQRALHSRRPPPNDGSSR